MTEMRDRLIELLGDYLYSEQIADHLIANGVICPPCKVGDKLYITASVSKAIVESVVLGVWMREDNISILTIHGSIHSNSLGETVFLTKEEAEKALNNKNN